MDIDMDLQDFDKATGPFAPKRCLTREQQKEHAAAKRARKQVLETHMRSMTQEDLHSWLDTIIANCNDNDFLSGLLNATPLAPDVPAFPLDDINLSIEDTLLQLAVATFSAIAANPRYDRSACDLVLGKLQLIMRIRELMWRLARVQRGFKDFEGQDAYNDRLAAIVKVGLKLRFADAHKRQGMVCFPKYSNGYRTGYYEPVQTIRDYLYKCANRYLDPEMWQLLTANGQMINSLDAYFTENKHLPEFPEVKVDHGCFSFTNGVYSALADTFVPYENQPTTTTVNFIDAEWRRYDTPDWRDIPTPHFDRIFDCQEITGAVRDWIYVMIGRSLFPLKRHDKWEAAIFFQGVAGSGKSTIVNNLYGLLFDEASIFLMSNNIESQFGLAEALRGAAPYLVCCGSEIGKNFRLDQKEFQTIISGEQMSVAIKHGKPVTGTWTLPLVLAGNNPPSYEDESGSIARRLLVVRFKKPLAAGDKDPHLAAKIATEIPFIIQKVARAYKEQLDLKTTRKDIWDLVPEYFRESQAELKAATNALEAFLQSDQVVYDPDAYCQLKDFRDAAKMFARGTRLPPLSTTEDALADVFAPRNVKIVRGAKKWQGTTKSTKWVVGCSLLWDTEADT